MMNQSKSRGALLMCAAMFAGSAIDVAVKALSGDYSTSQIVFLRGMIAIPLVLCLVHYQVGMRELVKLPLRWQLWRGLLTAGANFGFFYGLKYLPLVTVLMLAYVSPVVIVLLAKPILGERVGVAQFVGVIIGFAGVADEEGVGDLRRHADAHA